MGLRYIIPGIIGAIAAVAPRAAQQEVQRQRVRKVVATIKERERKPKATAKFKTVCSTARAIEEKRRAKLAAPKCICGLGGICTPERCPAA